MKDRMRFLVAGADGVLGRELVQSLHRRGIPVLGLGYRKPGHLSGLEDKLLKFIPCDVRQTEQLKGICDGIDVVISTIGITRLKANLTHMDVDYQGNLNLLNEARRSKVGKFVFISPAGVEKGHRYVPLMKAKYLFEEALKNSGINWLIFRSGGFFNDLAEFGKTARKGPLYVIGKGSSRFTPIDVKDLAEVMIEDSLTMNNKVIEVGGPEDLSWQEICEHCFAVSRSRVRIIRIPAWICKSVVWFIKPFSPKNFAMGRLLVFTSTVDLPTAKRGTLRFRDYLKKHT